MYAEIPMDGLHHYNEELHQWERRDRVQEYKGVKIETIHAHMDVDYGDRNYPTRFYRITFKNGHVWDATINKRGGNIKSIKDYIDFKERYGNL